MKSIAVYSEKGGVGKTTTTVGIAAAAAAAGLRVGVIDLDPQATASRWLRVEPREKGLHVGAILADEDPSGWASGIAVPAGWPGPGDIEVVPSTAQLANRERAAAGEDAVEGRLRASLAGWDRDLVVIDVPNRQGGPLIGNALTAVDSVVVPLTLDEDGLDALDRTHSNVERFRRSPWNPAVRIEGIVATLVPTGIPSKDLQRAWQALLDGHDRILGSVPLLVIVKESRTGLSWWGNHESNKYARRITERYAEICAAVLEGKE